MSVRIGEGLGGIHMAAVMHVATTQHLMSSVCV